MKAIFNGVYIIRVSTTPEKMNAEDCVRNYKKSSQLERAFRTVKKINENIKLIYRYKESKAQTHLFFVHVGLLCLILYA